MKAYGSTVLQGGVGSRNWTRYSANDTVKAYARLAQALLYTRMDGSKDAYISDIIIYQGPEEVAPNGFVPVAVDIIAGLVVTSANGNREMFDMGLQKVSGGWNAIMNNEENSAKSAKKYIQLLKRLLGSAITAQGIVVAAGTAGSMSLTDILGGLAECLMVNIDKFNVPVQGMIVPLESPCATFSRVGKRRDTTLRIPPKGWNQEEQGIYTEYLIDLGSHSNINDIASHNYITYRDTTIDKDIERYRQEALEMGEEL